jgi:hypothetical protein
LLFVENLQRLMNFQIKKLLIYRIWRFLKDFIVEKKGNTKNTPLLLL